MRGSGEASKTLSKAALLAAGAFGLWGLAPSQEAQAACTVTSGTGTVNNMGPNADVECAGVTTGVTVFSGNTSPLVSILTGAAFNQSSVAIGSGADGAFVEFQSGSTADGSGIYVDGPNSVVLLDNATFTNSAPFIITGANNIVQFNPGSSVTFANGAGMYVSGAGSFFALNGGSVIGDTGSTVAIATIIGGAGSQEFQIQGTVTAGGNGVAINMDDGNDLLVLFNLAQITGSLVGGLGTDTLRLEGANTLSNQSLGFERLEVINGANWTLSGSHQFTNVIIDNSVLTTTTFNALGATNALVDINATGRLRVSTTGQTNFTRSVVGAGILEYNGGGDLVFNATNANFTGQLLVTDGTIIVNNGGAFGTAQIVNNDIVRIGNVVLPNNISGTGAVEKTSSGQGVLSGVNTYSGGTSVLGGSLQAVGVAALGSGPVNVAANTTLDYNIASGQEVNGVTISGAGGLIKSGSGAIVFSNTNTYTGGTTISGGTVVLNTGSALGTGAITNNALLRIGGITLANNISGTGAVEKTANNIADLTGTNTYTGGTSVLGGTLRAGLTSIGTGQISLASGTAFELTAAANGVLPTVAANANSNFRIAGVGRVTVNNGVFGNLDVAGSAHIGGPVTVAGAQGLRFLNGARLTGTGSITGNVNNAGILGPGASVGTLTINGNYVHASTAILEIEFGPGTALDLLNITGTATIQGGTLRLISLGNGDGAGQAFLTAAGGVTGTFGTIEVPNGGAAAVVLYNANNIMIPPTMATARPSTVNSQMALTGQSMAEFMNLLGDEIRSGEQRSVWARVLSNVEERDAVRASLGYSFDTTGAAGGFRTEPRNGVSLGLAVASTHGAADLDNSAGSTKVEAVLGAVSINWQGDRFFAGGGVTVGTQDFSTDRVVVFNNVTSTMHGESRADTMGAYVSGGVRGSMGGWNVWGSASASYMSNSFDGYAEQGTNPLRLNIHEFDAQNATVNFEVGGEQLFTLGNGVRMTPRFRAGLVGDLALDNRAVPITFAVSNQTATLKGDGSERVFAAFGAGLDVAINDQVSIVLDLRHLASDDAQRSLGSAGLRIAF